MESREVKRSLAVPTVLAALVFVLGAESMRFLFASITWYLRDTLGIATLTLVPIALGPFLLALLLPALSRPIGLKPALWWGVGILALSRTALQMFDSPSVDFWMAAVATAAFVGLLPLLLSLGRAAMVGGVLLGLAADTIIKGAGFSLDLSYQRGLATLAAAIVISVAALYFLRLVDPPVRSGVSWGSGALLLGLGPYLFAQLVVLQSQGWLSSVTGLSAEGALLQIVLVNVVALYLAYRYESSRTVLIVCSVIVTLAVILGEAPGGVFEVASLMGLAAAGPAWAALVPETDRESLAASSVYLVGGSVIFLIFGLAYYLPLDLRLGFTQSQARFVVAVLLGLVTLAGSILVARRRRGVDPSAPVLATVGLVLPLVTFLVVVTSTPAEVPTTGYPVRFMTYNLHSAFDTSGRMDVEAIAKTIEGSGATVVGLQEVSRGRLINAGTDLLALLQHRLGFRYAAFFGTADPVWGNAILSRYPLGTVETAYLPLEGTPLRRGYLAAPVSIGDNEILFISIHLQHINHADVAEVDPEGDLYPVHHAQIAKILEEWDGRSPAILVGDFNAEPGWRQIDELLSAGWVDSWQEAGSGPGLTSNAADPQHRIDWVFHTPDLTAVNAETVASRASDHYPVVADISAGSP